MDDDSIEGSSMENFNYDDYYDAYIDTTISKLYFILHKSNNYFVYFDCWFWFLAGNQLYDL